MKLSEFKKKVIELKGNEVWEDIKESPEYEVYIASEKEQIEEIKRAEGNILYINNPTKEMQLEAIKYYGSYIEYIKNPSEELQLQAVAKEGENIRFIENPTDEVITETIKTIDHKPDFRFILRHIENDSEETVKLSKLRDMTLDEIKDLLDN
jgi:putative uncharacterized protein (fragment)|nr:MAG TPA: protein of unknown function (DUF4116) [Caudoviricetes sp.]